MALSTSEDFKLDLGVEPLRLLPIVSRLEDFVRPFCAALDAFHADWSGWGGKATYYFTGKQAWVDARLAALDAAEHLLYRLFDLERERLSRSKASRLLLMRLLVEIQEKHIELVDYVHTKNLLLFTPDRATLGTAARQQLDADWDALRNGTGAVALPTDAQFARGNREVRAIHARLLSRPHGRSLMRWILASTPQDPVWPVTLVLTQAFTPSAQFRQRVAANRQRLTEMSGQLRPLEEEYEAVGQRLSQMEVEARRGNEPWGELRERLKVASRAYAELSATQGELGGRIDHIRDELPKYEEDGHGEDYMLTEPAPGIAGKTSGRGSRLSLRSGLRDSTQRNYSGEQYPIPAPAFIVYGHELIHILQHRYPTRMVLDPLTYPHGHTKHGYSNTTEHETIRSLRKRRTGAHLPFFENQLREEHQLPKRKHHNGTTAFDLGELD
ncbi:hypothetical protein D7X96_13640 [Corallococcus interemptor]|uniref:Uncharacterized protein n=1 Tax=Corallococcus interemptor TaxID=2316720 RepID=A0A3A8QSI2_9BACT|nr:hypothetical protein [Corallococcus interemptor]RKH38589.1 hypothetical protein D7Y23_37880 [Corallococcus sp. AB050B]RKH69850.1 hypothetical protein D7X96_13640 [Corallococcus interemptor]